MWVAAFPEAPSDLYFYYTGFTIDFWERQDRSDPMHRV